MIVEIRPLSFSLPFFKSLFFFFSLQADEAVRCPGNHVITVVRSGDLLALVALDVASVTVPMIWAPICAEGAPTGQYNLRSYCGVVLTLTSYTVTSLVNLTG